MPPPDALDALVAPAPAAVWRAALAAVALVSAVPLAALGAFAWHGALVRRWAPHAAAMAVGALAGAALFQLLPEAYARAAVQAGGRGAVPAGSVPAAVALGVAAFFALEWLLHGTHDHHAHGHHGDHAHHGHAHDGRPHHAHGPDPRRGALVRLAVAGDALHNLVDGALIAATFLADARAGLLTTAAVALHEVPREFGTFGAVVHGGASPRRALAYNAATALAAGAGAVVTLVFGARAAELAPAVLPFAAGNFLYLAGALLRSLARVEGEVEGGADAAAAPSGPGAWTRRLAFVGLGLLATGLPALV